MCYLEGNLTPFKLKHNQRQLISSLTLSSSSCRSFSSLIRSSSFLFSSSSASLFAFSLFRSSSSFCHWASRSDTDFPTTFTSAGSFPLPLVLLELLLTPPLELMGLPLSTLFGFSRLSKSDELKGRISLQFT